MTTHITIKKEIALKKFVKNLAKVRTTKLQLRLIKRSTSLSGHQIKTTIKSSFKYLFVGRFVATACKRGGHNNTGRYTVHSKGACKKFKRVFVTRTLDVLKYFVYLLWYCRSPRSRSHAMLVATTSGRVCYIPLTNRCSLLSLVSSFGATFFGRLFGVYVRKL